MSQSDLKRIVNAFVISRIDYCNIVKEPTHLSERVGDEIPGVVVWPCFMGWCFT